MDQILICPKCKNLVGPTDFFCPTCGFKIIGGALSPSLLKQISIYLISFLLPPFGLIPAIKYLKQGDPKSKQIGIIAIVLTLLSVIISFFILQSFMNSYNEALNGVSGGYENFDQLLK
jgi:hypothetical protein